MARFPAWLRTQKNLIFLFMSNARISDEIPDWSEVVYSHINTLDLSLNNITGKVPKFKKTFNNYTLINLSSNKFEAMSSHWFPSDINILDLSENYIVRPIPLPEDLRISFLNYLLLNDNYFSDNIPESICNVRSLRVLDLSNNQLSGTLPLCLGNLRNLNVLRLSNNSLYGKIPSSLGNIEFLGSLTLNRNNFHGQLPKSLQYLIYMQFLDLSENKLEGIIPSWISKYLLKLRVLRLQSNHFHGHVPTHLCQLSELQILNLAQNNLSGIIPQCFNNLSAMILNDSYFEKFQYEHLIIFSGLSEKLISFMGGKELKFKVKELKSLDLSQNNTVGGIPNELMDLIGLQSFVKTVESYTGDDS